MSLSVPCARCGAPTHAQTLEGLCPTCVGRRLLLGEIPPADLPPEETESAASTPSSPPTDTTPSSPLDSAWPSATGFRLVRELGEGGFGIVYLAEQLAPVKRQVALKVIKLGMDTRQVVARFEAERQALALMDHPGIARVFEAGATVSGRPYFVMEFVEGLPITLYADRKQLTIAQRLELFAEVCDAVQHAHQKGVIHRDLKPSNVLVADRDGKAVPKVIDFGLAKATQVELTDKTLITHFQQLLGTPAYMSPEQVEMGAADVDTRSDIYSLGVLLYELLTGQTPFEAKEMLSLGLDEVRRTIREVEPVRPSTRLKREVVATGDHPSPIAHRQSSIDPDLDWIVMKALEKDRTRRYATANALALDIQRHLNSEPVGARPPTALYQFQKLVHRNKLAVASATAVILALIAGLGVATLALLKENRARLEASLRAEESRQRLVRLHIATGSKLVDEGDSFNALLWYIEAFRLEGNDSPRSDIHRRRIESMLRDTPRLAQVWWHDSLVQTAEFSPDGRRVASTSLDGTTRLWDAHTGNAAFPWLEQNPHPERASFTPDGQRLLTLDRPGHVRIWNAQTGQGMGPALPTAAHWAGLDPSPDGRSFLAGVSNGVQLFDAKNGTAVGAVIPVPGPIQFLRFSPDGRSSVVGGSSHDAELLEIPTGQRLWRFPGTRGLRGVAYSPDGRLVATLSTRKLDMWHTATGEKAWPTIQPGGDLFDCQFSPDGRRVVVASWNRFARLFDAETGAPLGVPMRHPSPVTQAIFSPNGRWLATASRDGTTRVWHPETGEPLTPPMPQAAGVSSVAFAPDSSRLVASSLDHSVRLWELRTNSPARLTLPHSLQVFRLCFNQDGTRLLTAVSDNDARIWNVQSGELIARLRHGTRIEIADFSQDGRRVLTGTHSGSVRVWDVDRGVELIPTINLSNRVMCVAFSPDGECFLTTAGLQARVWSARTGEAVSPWISHTQRVMPAAFSPDGRRLITGGRDAIAQVWDVQTGSPIGPPLPHPCGVVDVAFSPDGRRVVTACSDAPELSRFAQVWDAVTGRPIGQAMHHRDGVLTAEFSPDGKRVVTASSDDSARIWDSETGQALTAPVQHQDDVPRAIFSPDGRLLLTVSWDQTARVWDAATGEPVSAPLRHADMVMNGAWSPNGREVVTASWDGKVHVWDISPTQVPLTELKREAELLSAHRIEANIGSVPLSAEELKHRWSQRKAAVGNAGLLP